jgi:hypothetical protein
MKGMRKAPMITRISPAVSAEETEGKADQPDEHAQQLQQPTKTPMAAEKMPKITNLPRKMPRGL